MKNLQEIIKEAEKDFDKLQLESVCHTHDCDTYCLKPFITSLISRIAHLVAEKALEAVPEKDVVYPGCKQCTCGMFGTMSSCPCNSDIEGHNRARSDLKEAMGEYLKEDL